MILLSVRNNELVTAIQEYAAEHSIEHAALSVVGVVEGYALRITAGCDVDKEMARVYDQAGDLTASGDVADGRVSLVGMVASDGTPRAGRILKAQVGVYGARVFITPVTASVPRRALTRWSQPSSAQNPLSLASSSRRGEAQSLRRELNGQGGLLRVAATLSRREVGIRVNGLPSLLHGGLPGADGFPAAPPDHVLNLPLPQHVARCVLLFQPLGTQLPQGQAGDHGSRHSEALTAGLTPVTPPPLASSHGRQRNST